MHMFKDITGKGTYAKYQTAVKKVETLNSGHPTPFRYIIAATEDGRFFPVIVLDSNRQYLAGPLAFQGFCVTF